MRNVGFCGVDEIANTLGVLEDLERFAVEDRVFGNNDDIQHSFSADDVFA